MTKDGQLVLPTRAVPSDALTIALVEDDPDHALLALEALEERGHRVVLYRCAGDALAAYRPRAWDAIILDYRLPDMSGLEALDRFLSKPEPPPVVMITASGSEEIAVAAMKRGAKDYVVKTGTHGMDLARAVELAAAKQRMQDVVSLHQRELERRANTDALTGLLNRHRLADELSIAALRAALRGDRYAIAMLDIDGFKHINDTCGHAAGDMLLAEFAALLRSCTRKEDLLARYGGDEFVVVMPGVDERSCLTVIERIRAALGDFEAARRLHCAISVSIGIADCSAGDPEDVLAAADSAMYRNKAARG
jgi:two-component system cell cycle response regulator